MPALDARACQQSWASSTEPGGEWSECGEGFLESPPLAATCMRLYDYVPARDRHATYDYVARHAKQKLAIWDVLVGGNLWGE